MLVALNNQLLGIKFVHFELLLLLLLLFNNRFGIVGKLMALILGLLHFLAFDLVFHVERTQHVVPLDVFLHPFDFFVVFLLGHGLLELI